MEFDLDEFVTRPSLNKIDKYKKAELLIIAKVFNVQVPYNTNKAELKRLLCTQLMEKGILPQPAAKAIVGDTAGDAPVPEMKAAEVVCTLADVVECQPVTSPLLGAGMTTENLCLTLQMKEMEARNKQLEVQVMHLRISALELEKEAPVASSPTYFSGHSMVSAPVFGISKHIALVPPFRESEVDSYFSAFERIAVALSWPKEFWSLLLQCKFVGKAKEVCF